MKERIRISEIFGPTIQGEGPLVGRPTVFVRTGGCDYRCTWCDTLYAVLPEYHDEWTPMTPAAIMARVNECLRRLRRDGPTHDRFVFMTERSTTFTRDGVLKMFKRAGEVAGLAVSVHPHMLRHAAGFKLANDNVPTRTMQHLLGHRNIAHSVRYTAMTAKPLEQINWRAF